MAELFSKIGKKVKIAILVGNLIVLGLLISGSVKDTSPPLATPEPESLKSLNSQGTSPVSSEVTQGSKLDMWKLENFDPNKLSWKSSKLDHGTCPGSFSEDQLNVMEERTSDSEDSKPFEGWQEQEHGSVNGAPLSTVQANPDTNESHNNSKIKQREHYIKHELTSSSLNPTTMDESSFNIKNDDLVQNTGDDNIKNHVLGIEVVFLKNNCWIFIYFAVMLLDGMFNFITPMLDIWIGIVATVVLAIEVPSHLQSAQLAFSWLYIPILMHLTAYFLMVLSVILRCTSRSERLSDVAAGATFTSSTFAIILSVIVSTLPSQYVFVCIAILIVLAIIWVVHRVRDGAIQGYPIMES